ncbi:ABC transporter ATP-binding protein [Phytohalomonas tamaricis]|uniref:ABC transporter ATP-binding protein n=1 Tax=Phytohalomonas tamaricis TaxID=2081032 RepID=UPI000D0B43B0|nr:ABC transporter ATP-binding protein [Phytohalomonas tamaricis]
MSALGVRIDAARLKFRDQWLFKDIACELPAGSWTCLLGRSGCGKSSLLRLIAGLPLPETSHIAITTDDGQPLAGRVAWMAQQDFLLPWRRVIDNVVLGPSLRGKIRRSDIERGEALLESVGLADKRHQWPAALSGGQRQRIALARTLFESAPLIMMDEPFSALDAITRLELHELAARLLASRTVLLVTHDPFEALRLADQMLIFQGHPAHLERLGPPPGERPRDPADPRLNAWQAQLLHYLRHEPVAEAGDEVF